MSLVQLNNILVDLYKISYIGELDTHIEHSVQLNRIIHFFLIVVDGYPIEIESQTREDLELTRNKLVSLIEIK